MELKTTGIELKTKVRELGHQTYLLPVSFEIDIAKQVRELGHQTYLLSVSFEIDIARDHFG